MQDYSFLLSDDADLPASEGKKPPPPRNVSVSKSGMLVLEFISFYILTCKLLGIFGLFIEDTYTGFC